MEDWLKTLHAKTRLVVVHPNFSAQHPFMWLPISMGATYLRFEGWSLTLSELQGQFKNALRQQDFEKSMQYLILDEVDRANHSDLAQFVRELLDNFPQCLIILLGRVVPISIISDTRLKAVVEFLPVNNATILYDYSQIEPHLPLLEVRALGAGHVVYNGVPVTRWDGVLPRLLFFFFLDRAMVTRDEIFETFWPEMSIREATNVFHVTKRKISEVLGFDLTVYTSGFYCISPQAQLRYDVLQFNQMLQDSEMSESVEMETLLLNTISLYRGDFLLSSDADWVVRRREEIRLVYSEALFSLGSLYAQQGKPEHAMGYFLRAYRHNPSDERLLSQLPHLAQ